MKLDKETIEDFKDILDQEFDTYSYSGRGMYGEKCLAITISREASIAGVTAQIMYSFDYEFKNDRLNDLVSIFERSKTDDMGRDTVMYFPNIEWIWDDSNETEDEDDE
jgi:hypothetical protein